MKGRRLPTCALAIVALVATISPLLAAKPPTDLPTVENGLSGQLLVASPEMRDPRFAGTVIFMVRHDSHGAMGLVINRLLGSGSVAELLRVFGLEDDDAKGTIRMHYGGPVEPQYGFVLHSTDYARDGTILVNKDVAMTSEVEVLRAISRGKGPRRSLFAFGYAGWGPGQLEGELARKAWITVPADKGILFDDDLDSKWQRAMARRGFDL